MNNGTILYGELLDILDKKIIGRSVSYPCGWIKVEDLYKIADDIKSEKFRKVSKNMKDKMPK